MQALLLAALAVALPLSLRHHLWVQALTLRTPVPRVRRLALLHAALPGGASECAAFAAAACLAVAAVAPGSLPPAVESLTSAQLCWSAHFWSAAMLGLALPAAVLAALEQHAAQQRQLATARRRAGADPADSLPPSPTTPFVSCPSPRPPNSPLPAPPAGTAGASLKQRLLAGGAASRRALARRLLPLMSLSCTFTHRLLVLRPVGAALFAALDLATALAV